MTDSINISFDRTNFTLSAALFPPEHSGLKREIDHRPCSFSNPETGIDDVKSLLLKLAKVKTSDRFTETKAIIDCLPARNIEAMIYVLLKIRFRLPTPPAGQVAPAWPEYLLEKLPICLEAALLAQHCQAYPWYLAASRRAVTIAHMSEKGLSKDFLKFVDRLTKTNPALAFALSPTTLHDNTLVAPKVAQYFTCSPFGKQSPSSFTSQGIETTYKTVFLNDKSDHVKLGASNRFPVDQKNQESTAKSRLMVATNGIYDQQGSFPWLHPSRPDTGVILAGGLPCGVMLDEAKWRFIAQTTDIDLFIYGDSEEDRKDMTRIVLEHLESLGGKISHFVSVFKVDGLGREIQVVCPYARSPLGVLINFDTTFIQVGHQAGHFLATPGYCFFTPRSETLITRYNVRFHRMLKAIERGFMPVSDERGHLMYPTKTLFSSRWPFSLSSSKPRTEEWVNDSARSAYLVIKKMTNVSIGTFKTLPIEDPELFAVLVEEFREKLVEFNSQQKVHLEVYNPEAKPTPTADGKSTKTKTIVADIFLNTSKPDIAWIPTTTAEAMKTFHPQGATLSNGFDIYTAGVNSTLPIPEDGQTEDIYLSRVLLRNVTVLPSVDSTTKDGKKTYNLAAPKDKPLTVPHIPFLDTSKQYPADKYSLKTGTEAEPVREIEGIFLFADVKDPKTLDSEYQQYIKRREENAAKFKRLVELKRTARHERLKLKHKKRHELENQRRAAKGLVSLEEQAELDRKAIEARRKLKQAKDEAFIATKNAKAGKKSSPKQAEVKTTEKEPAFVIDGLKFNHPEWDTFTERQKDIMIMAAKNLLYAAKRRPLTAEVVSETIGFSRTPGDNDAIVAKLFNGAILNQSLTTNNFSLDLANMQIPLAKDKEELYEVEAVGPNAKEVQAVLPRVPTAIPPTPLGYFTVASGRCFLTPINWNKWTDFERRNIISIVNRILKVAQEKDCLADTIVDIEDTILRHGNHIGLSMILDTKFYQLDSQVRTDATSKRTPGGLLDKPTAVPDGYFMVEDGLFPIPSGWGKRTTAQRNDIVDNIKRILKLGRDKNYDMGSLRADVYQILRTENLGHYGMAVALTTKYCELEKQGLLANMVKSSSRGSPNSVAQIHGTVTPVVVKNVKKQIQKKLEKSAKERLREAQRELDEEKADLEKEQRDKRNFSLRTTIDFEDLHKQLVVPKDVITIGVHELPLLYKAFAKGGKQYTTLNKEVVKRSTGMVRVRAPVTFDDCLIFDVDDLFLPAKSVDNHPERRYNAVVNLSNLERWILAAHEHKDVLTTSSSRELIMAALQEELKKQDAQFVGQKEGVKVAEFMRAIRHVANQREFEEKANQVSCYKAHPHPGLPGEMPTLFLSRLYVSKI
jgi:hypothetical protein